jgi:signal transduction histidine kinase/CheY-like chemotaxis protein
MNRDATPPEDRRTGGADPDASFIAGGGETGALIRAIDWRATPLGPASEWPQSLRTALSICLSSRFPIALYWGPEFVMLYNDDILPMVGAKHPHAMGRRVFEVLPEIRDLIEPLLQRVISTGEATWSEDLMLPLLRHDVQEESYFTFTYSPIRDESGGVGGVFCAVLETTDKIIEERRLRLLNALADATQAKTPGEACALAAAQIARAPNDIPFALLYLIDETSYVARLAGTANIESGTPRAPTSIAPGDHATWPFEASGKAGPPRFVTLEDGPGGARGAVLLPIERAGGGRPLGFIVAGLSPLLRSSGSYDRFHNLLAASISQAVSNAAAYEAERKRAEALAELDRAKTTFFSNISHEFRTPLTLMLAPIQDMQAMPAGAPVDHAAVDLLHRNALRLLKLVNTLLEFSRIEAGRIDAVYEPFDLSALTADLASSFRAAIERAGLALVVDCPPLPEPVYVDRDMWEKIVLNLLSNAFKFTFDGAITVRLRADDAAVYLEIADTGIGIADDHLPRLFERFHRIEGVRSRSHEGSGIGLALIQELVRLQGGAVRVASKLGAGTTFEVRIPRGAAHLPEDRIRASHALASTALGAKPYVSEALRWGSPSGDAVVPSGPARRTTASRERIVFADDNADMREYVARLLGERWAVETVGDGVSAMAAIRHDPPALILCDVMMPGLDGFALAQAVRADAALRAIPIIILSARAGEEETAKGLGAGANDYIAKPFSARELLVRVASNLAAARTAEDMRAREQIQRENLYRHFMQAPFPVCVFRGRDHVIELANPQILRAWGKGTEVVGLPLLEAIPELRDQPITEYLDEVFRTGVAHEGRTELARLPTQPNGELEDVYFNFVYAPLRDTSGAIEGTLVSAFDVTEQVHARRERTRMLAEEQRAHAAAEAARARIHSLFMQAPAPICILEGPAHRYTFANQPFTTLVGRDDIVGRTVTEAFPEHMAQGVLELLDHAYTTGETFRANEVSFRFARRRPGQFEDGVFNFVYEPFRDLEGKVCGILVVLFDVTDVVLARRASEQARHEAEASAAAQRAVLEFQERFVAVLGHDLRNPLAAIDMATELLRHQADQSNDAVTTRTLGRIRSSSLRISRMVEQILDLSRSRVGGGLAVSPAPMDLGAVLTGVVEELRTAHPSQDIQLRCSSMFGTWDRDRLEQVFSNLISNAIHHGLSETPITIEARQDGEELQVDIHNEGPPIPEALRATLFEPFRRGDRDSRASKSAGLGLGLYISRELVVAHGGDISVRSSSAEGTTFRVTLPRTP